MYFIPLTVNLTKNSKLEKFVHELNALWKHSGSSMGALRELIAVPGIYLRIRICEIMSKCKHQQSHYDFLYTVSKKKSYWVL